MILAPIRVLVNFAHCGLCVIKAVDEEFGVALKDDTDPSEVVRET